MITLPLNKEQAISVLKNKLETIPVSLLETVDELTMQNCERVFYSSLLFMLGVGSKTWVNFVLCEPNVKGIVSVRSEIIDRLIGGNIQDNKISQLHFQYLLQMYYTLKFK